ncbi:hypothetical protein [Streptomyces sp. NPDC006739]|uniref:hypothetical protein n=1 Tax=Streptomyces sp. NPDC006739 TaxID=3364763 RepID=UPI00369DCBA2
MTVLSPEEMERLHRLITWESPSVMSEAAAAGDACVWCGGPLGEDAARLQTVVPRLGCRRCYSAHLAWYTSWYHWHDHVAGCTTACKRARVCYVGYGMRAAHDAARITAGREEPHCVSCHHPIHARELAVPVRWEGTSQDHLGYGHTQCLMTVEAAQ